MLYSTLMLMMSSAFLMLRLTPGGSFPRPLSEAEERKYLDAWLQGDLEARNVLIENGILRGYMQDRQNAMLMKRTKRKPVRRKATIGFHQR